MPCSVLNPKLEAIMFQMVRPQDVRFLDGYVLVPGRPFLQEVYYIIDNCSQCLYSLSGFARFAACQAAGLICCGI